MNNEALVGPARKAAALIVSRNDLKPPVPIMQILSAEAELTECDWPIPNVDAVMLRHEGKRPSIYYRRAEDRLLRQRFTLAHELGHLKLAWHLGNKACEVSSSSGRYVSLRPPEEREADTFASCVLVPDRWLKELVREHGDDMHGVLNGLAAAQVSTTASLIALRRALSGAWAFRINSNTEPFMLVGTSIPPEGFHALTDSAEGHGQSTLHGNTVCWWRLTGSVSALPEDADPRPTTELLRSAINSGESDPAAAKWIEQSANGKVGGWTKDDAGRPAEELYATLCYRFKTVAYSWIATHPDFQLWLARKARAKASR
ncbi:hypothetical protein J2W56_001290 [Nocardia kruczakiae]|uniref:IrrE N-terminal-like domain-containing protein n=1 Tax=Nocardia kruczakiae TaxID=261477 RepID=A0ABU1XAK3_9NOCA|nr:ImmA/IrrE family metallo-endopeptidase [Nocardia kruczakiae]MDR7167571.1 hypothetical protein [Nocardia kruczakiae]